MEDDIKNRLDQIEKRVEDFKWYVGIVGGLVILMFGLVAGLFGARAFFDAQSAKTELRESKKEIKEEVLGLTGRPEIELLGINREPLANQEVIATVEPSGATFKWKFPYIIKNKGASNSGTLFAKLYAQSESLKLINPSADETKYRYETYLTSKEIEPNPLPAGASVLNYFWIIDNTRPTPGKYPVLLKFFYGKDQVTQAAFQIVIP